MASSYTLDSLISDLKKNTYAPKTEEELKASAENRYKSAYDQKRLEAQQAADVSQLALDRQLSGVVTMTGKQKEASAKQYADAYSQLNRQATDRGMQRSSFNNATLSNIAVAGNKAQQEIADQEANNLTSIEDQKTLLARQLSDQIKQYSASQAADTLAYLDELELKEYDRSTAAADKSNSLAMQIYQFANQEKQQEDAQTQWLNQFNEQIRQYDSSLAEQSRQYNESLTEQRRATDLSNKYNYDQLAENTRQFDTQLAESTRQFEAQQAESKRQFDASLTEQQRQYDTSTAEGKRQFEASLSQQQKQMLEDIRQFDAQMAENQRQFDALHPEKTKTVTKYIEKPDTQQTTGQPPFNQKTLNDWAKLPINLPVYGSVKSPIVSMTSGAKKK